MVKGGGGGKGRFLGVDQEGIHRSNLEGVWGGGALGHVGKSNLVDNIYGYIIEHLTK